MANALLVPQFPQSIDTSKFALKSDLNGLASQSWVTGQGYATQAWVNAQGFATIAYVDSRAELASRVQSEDLTVTLSVAKYELGPAVTYTRSSAKSVKCNLVSSSVSGLASAGTFTLSGTATRVTTFNGSSTRPEVYASFSGSQLSFMAMDSVGVYKSLTATLHLEYTY